MKVQNDVYKFHKKCDFIVCDVSNYLEVKELFNLVDPVTLVIDLEPGWNWFSTNVESQAREMNTLFERNEDVASGETGIAADFWTRVFNLESTDKLIELIGIDRLEKFKKDNKEVRDIISRKICYTVHIPNHINIFMLQSFIRSHCWMYSPHNLWTLYAILF